MKVPLHIVAARREKLAAWLQQCSYVPIHEVCARFRISEATARRDLAALASGRRIRRTHGGALGDYTHRFPSFLERQRLATAGKREIGRKGWKMIRPGTTCFFDAGTTIFAIAEELQRMPIDSLTAVTNSLPVAELLAPVEGIEVQLLGGKLLPRQAVLLGEQARNALNHYTIDLAFMGIEGADLAGLWNSHEEVVLFQKALLATARETAVCGDATKLGSSAPAFICPWDGIQCLLTDANLAAGIAAGVPARFFK